MSVLLLNLFKGAHVYECIWFLSATLFVETMISICFLQYILWKNHRFQVPNSCTADVSTLHIWLNVSTGESFFIMVIDVNRGRKMSEAIRESELPSPELLPAHFSQIDIVCTCRESRGGFALCTAIYFLRIAFVGGGKGRNKVVAN